MGFFGNCYQNPKLGEMTAELTHLRFQKACFCAWQAAEEIGSSPSHRGALGRAGSKHCLGKQHKSNPPNTWAPALPPTGRVSSSGVLQHLHGQERVREPRLGEQHPEWAGLPRTLPAFFPWSNLCPHPGPS